MSAPPCPPRRRLAVGVALVLAWPAAAQQAPDASPQLHTGTPWGAGRVQIRREPAIVTPTCTLWVRYADATSQLPDHATWLGDLQSRLAERGVRIGVALDSAAAAAVAARHPGFDVIDLGPAADGEANDQSIDVALCMGGSSDPVARWNSLDGASDRLEAALDDALARTAPGEVDDLVESLLYQAGDGGQEPGPARYCIEKLPHSGRAHAALLLCQWWSQGDYDAAAATFDAALRALADDSVPLVAFADLALRGDRTDPSQARRLMMALVPAAAAAPDGIATQLVYLRALRRTGQHKLAQRTASQLPALLVDRPLQQLWFAETLMDGPEPKAFRALAEQALDQAAAGGADARLWFAARCQLLASCGDDTAELLQQYRGSDTWSHSYNNDAWYLSTEIGTMGRFPQLALAQAEAMLQSEGRSISFGNLDTVGLVLFLGGQHERAVELQTQAVRGSQNDPRYAGRLRRFEAALARSKAPPAPGGEGPRQPSAPGRDRRR